MKRWLCLVLCVAGGLLSVPCPALPCSLCLGDLQQRKTMRQDAAEAKVLLFGSMANPRLNAGNTGTTDLRIEKKLKDHAFVKDKEKVEIGRYIPVSDPKDPPKFIIFCDIYNDKLDAWRGVPVKSAEAADYLKEALALDPKDRSAALLYFFRYLEHPDKEVAGDAFLEFAKSSDQDIGQVARKLSADKLRGWLKDEKTPTERLSLYAFLLGACGSEKDAALFRSLLQDPTERNIATFDGLLGGYIQLRPKEGWDLAIDLLRDGKQKFAVRYAVIRTMRFYHGWKPEESRPTVLRGMETIIAQGELADLALEDLRRWQLWDLTRDILSRYGKKGYDAPITKRAILRYALSCPKAEAKEFVAGVRKQDPDLVKDVEESLQFEKK